VSAWEVPPLAYGDGFAPPLDPATIDAIRDRAQRVADEACTTVRQREPSVEVDGLAVVGRPVDVLLAQGAEAELIVVGRRGLGGFRSLLLGSVSQQVVHYATCPVVVVSA
jgi:nucleotide-binding universal stress UspA family protein